MSKKAGPKNNKPNKPNGKSQQQLLNQINKLTTAVNLLKANNFNRFATMKPKDHVHARVPGLKADYVDYHNDVVADYVYGLFHPEAVYRENLIVKTPSPLPIPTTTFAFKETFNINPNAAGNFVLAWQPNYLGSVDGMRDMLSGAYEHYVTSCVAYNNSETLLGNSDNPNWAMHCFKEVQQSFAKYRLTSAGLKVQYTGNVFGQAGLLSACATYFDFPRTVFGSDQPLKNDYAAPNVPQLAKVCDFDIIRQGQWAHTINVVKNPEGLTCLYLPSDPLSNVFVANAETIDSRNQTEYWGDGYRATYWYPKNANLSYLICGTGLPNTSSVTVEAYYNFEIIVHEEQMPYFRSTPMSPALAKVIPVLQPKLNAAIANRPLLVESKDYNKPTILERIRSWLRTAKSFAMDVAPLVKLALGTV